MMRMPVVRRVGLALMLAVNTSGTAAAQDLLVDRTVALIGRAVILRSDVRSAIALGLVEATGADAERTATTRLIERTLVLQEVSRFAPPDPPTERIEARLAAVARHAGSPAAVDAVLLRGGLSSGWLTAWIRDDLRIAAYLDQRFAAAGVVTDLEVSEYAVQHAALLAAAGIPDAEREQAARDRLQAERRRELIADWLAELRRRTVVVQID